MTPNLSRTDRVIRAVIAVALIAVGGLAAGSADTRPLFVLAGLVAATAVVARCPLYRVYGVATLGGVHRISCDEGGSCGVRPPGRRASGG